MGGWWLPRLVERRGVLVLRDFWWRSLHTPSAGSALLSNLNSLWQLLGNFFSYVWRRSPLTAAAHCRVLYGEISPNPLHSCGWLGKMCMPTSADGIIWGSFAGMITQVGKNQTFSREQWIFSKKPHYISRQSSHSRPRFWSACPDFQKTWTSTIRPGATGELNSLERTSL